MASLICMIALLLLSLCLSFSSAACNEDELQTYIVHIHKPPRELNGTHRDWHHSFLRSSNVHESRLVYSYSHVLSGFAARLTLHEVEAMREAEGFVHAYPDSLSPLHTTHSPSFLGLHPIAGGFWSKAGFGKGVIIGVIDTGIAPQHPSFDGAGMPPPPSRWKGRCDFKLRHLCNNKLIGARTFKLGNPKVQQPYDDDDDGHGTHVAGIAAGSFVSNASLLGSASGIASGVAPAAHLAVYKVCHVDGCSDADIVAGIEQAVADGVDVISMSLGRRSVPLYDEPRSIAALAAVKKGVFFSASGGNRGPDGSLSNAAPWMLTVAASTMDRRIRAVVKLGNGAVFEGESAYQPENFPSTLLHMAYAQSCDNVTELEFVGVKGKIVVCDFGGIDDVKKGEMVKSAGGAAMILLNPSYKGFETEPEAHILPASLVNYADGEAIMKYMQSASNPKATIVFRGTHIGGGNAPAVATFSSRGPSGTGVLKPDVMGPGVNVLAASSKPGRAFHMLSGTSMACPHLSGVAALLKGFHPEWSPAMIKSAILTTADVTDRRGRPISDLKDNKKADVYATGAGHVNPLRASNPGLVYDIQEVDYVAHLCAIGYTDKQVTVVAGEKVRCSKQYRGVSEGDLNYPSIEVSIKGVNGTGWARRTVTNVGQPRSTYTLKVERPRTLTVEVDKKELVFSDLGEKAEYKVKFGVNRTEAAGMGMAWLSEGSLTWVSSDGDFSVRSPISVIVDTTLV